MRGTSLFQEKCRSAFSDCHLVVHRAWTHKTDRSCMFFSSSAACCAVGRMDGSGSRSRRNRRRSCSGATFPPRLFRAVNIPSPPGPSLSISSKGVSKTLSYCCKKCQHLFCSCPRTIRLAFDPVSSRSCSYCVLDGKTRQSTERIKRLASSNTSRLNRLNGSGQVNSHHNMSSSNSAACSGEHSLFGVVNSQGFS